MQKVDFISTCLHSRRDEEGRDHDRASGQEIRVGVQERGQPEVVHDQVVQAAVRRLVHGRRHRPPERDTFFVELTCH